MHTLFFFSCAPHPFPPLRTAAAGERPLAAGAVLVGQKHRLHPALHLQLPQNIADVFFRRPLGDEERLADFRVAVAKAEQRKDILLPLGQKGERVLFRLLPPLGIDKTRGVELPPRSMTLSP